jgi:hypothetical protein
VSEQEGLIPRSYRLPKSVVTYLDTLPDKSDFVIKALESAIAEHRLLNENGVIGRAKAIEAVEGQISAIEEDPTYRDATKAMRVLSIDEKSIQWLGALKEDRSRDDVIAKKHAEVGWFYPDGKVNKTVSFTVEAFDRYHAMGLDYYERIVADFKTRIQQLVDKREKLKAEILKNSPA